MCEVIARKVSRRSGPAKALSGVRRLELETSKRLVLGVPARFGETSALPGGGRPVMFLVSTMSET